MTKFHELALFLSIWYITNRTWLKTCIWWWLKNISIDTLYTISIIKIITSETSSCTIWTTWSSGYCRIPISITSCALLTGIILLFKIFIRTWISWTCIWARLKEIPDICWWDTTFCTICCLYFTLLTTIHTWNTY